ncbi:RNA 2',3'-cyclic phosphodiesterase [Thermodesulfobacterium sp. TA1]|uniref:RNA 2',3'-cyclic phosphodiesterase n=1 Tax=Thermodesulfobacterium sp. TA1 TaxID=2234087 RepID=UPI00143DDE7E|nr:RNA 2',3'-cyclic phosphodiesterase [Thermodesulfobacterium sp. TA1]
MRAFLGIDLPSELKKGLSELEKIKQPEGLKAKWVEEENFHLTLVFFGNVSADLLERLSKSVEKVLTNYPGFVLTIDKIGFFPEKGTPRVVWIGLKEPTGTLVKLVEDLHKAFKKFKLKLDQRFHPHITLFRVKELVNKTAFEEYFKNLSEIAQKLEGFRFPVKEVKFFESTLTPKGPIYKTLKEVSLGL